MRLRLARDEVAALVKRAGPHMYERPLRQELRKGERELVCLSRLDEQCRLESGIARHLELYDK